MTKLISRSALIAAIYAALALFSALVPGWGMMQYGMVQIRVSEALTVLAGLTPAAIPGLFLGCIISNMVGLALLGGSLLDVIFGSLATLLAAVLSYALRKYKWLVPLPPVVVNAVIVGFVLKLTAFASVPCYLIMLCVAAGQFIACYVLGMPLLLFCKKHERKLKLNG